MVSVMYMTPTDMNRTTRKAMAPEQVPLVQTSEVAKYEDESSGADMQEQSRYSYEQRWSFSTCTDENSFEIC